MTDWKSSSPLSPVFTRALNPVFATGTYSSDRSAEADRCTAWRVQLIVTEVTARVQEFQQQRLLPEPVLHRCCLPVYLAFDSVGNLWMTNNNLQFVEYNTSGSVLAAPFGGSGNGNGQFTQASGIALDNGGVAPYNVWVVDSGGARAEKFNSSGSYLLTAGGPCGHSCGNGQMNRPFGVAVDSSNNIYVTDSNNHLVQKFNGSTGAWISAFSYGTLTHVIAMDSSGNLWVSCCPSAPAVQEFNTSGSTLSGTFGGTAGSGNGQFNANTGVGQLAIH